MATAKQLAALKDACAAARAAGHVWPEFAACEAMVESAWGTTECFVAARNPFGRKQSVPPVFESLALPTWEVVHGHRQNIVAQFVAFPDLATAYRDRMEVLRRLAGIFPEYAHALKAASGADFVKQVSLRWSTDPERAAKVLAIHAAHGDVLGGER